MSGRQARWDNRSADEWLEEAQEETAGKLPKSLSAAVTKLLAKNRSWSWTQAVHAIAIEQSEGAP